MQLAQQAAKTLSNPPPWIRDLTEVWGIQNVIIEHFSSPCLGKQLQIRSLATGLSPRQKAHLRASSYWFCNASPDADYRELARRYQEAHYHLVELQEWSIAQQILWMPLGHNPLYRQLWFWGMHNETANLIASLLPQSAGGWQCFLLYEIGQIQAVLGQHEAAAQSFQQQIALAQKLQLPRALVKAYGGLGRLYSYHQASVTKALPYFQQQLRLARRCQDRLEEAFALDGLGRVSFLRGRWRKSTQLYRQAWKLSRTLDEPEAQQLLLLRLEGSYLHWSAAGKHRRTLQYQLEQARNEGNSQQLWAATHNLSVVNVHAKRWDEALALFEIAIATAKSTQNFRNYSISMAGQGACYVRMKAWSQAIACTEAAIPGMQQANDPVAEAVCWFNLSYCHSERHQPLQALRCATHIRRLAHQVESTHIRGMLYLAVANARWHQRYWLRAVGLAGVGIFYLGWWRSADGRLALAKVFSVLRTEIS